MLQSQVGDEEGSNTYKMRYDWADDETSRSRQCGKPYRTKEQEVLGLIIRSRKKPSRPNWVSHEPSFLHPRGDQGP